MVSLLAGAVISHGDFLLIGLSQYDLTDLALIPRMYIYTSTIFTRKCCLGA